MQNIRSCIKLDDKIIIIGFLIKSAYLNFFKNKLRIQTPSETVDINTCNTTRFI